jgi:DNA polymerase I
MQLTDFSLIQWLSSQRGRREFVPYIDQELAQIVEDTPVSRVYALSRLLEKQKDIASTRSPILDLESRLIEVLVRMEYRGIAVDRAGLAGIGVRITSDMRILEQEIYEVTGEIFNINSPKQIQDILFVKLGIKPTKKNKTGYSVDTEVLEEIGKTHAVAQMILDYRLLAKLSSTYIDGLTRSIDPITGRIHTVYDALWASTGRMSSNDPNLQNIPTWDGYAHEIKASFIPSEWCTLLVADYSQIELRVLAWLSTDSSLLEAFARGEDIHMRTARFLFPDLATISSHERRIAKTVNFWVIYGITGFGLAKTLVTSPWEADAYIRAFYERYPGVRSYYDTLLEDARTVGYVETVFGRRRSIPGVRDANKTIRSIAEREAMNMPIQGTAADMIKIAMIDIDAKIRDKWLRGTMILQVHDELVFDVPTDEVVVFEKLVRESMEKVVENSIFKIQNLWSQIPPFPVDIHTGENWADAKG